MRPIIKTAIIGQGPNEISWRGYLRRWRGNVLAAKEQAAREACTGAVGERLASLVGEVPVRFYVAHHRFNLNAEWNGKRNGVDNFKQTEAAITASTLLTMHPEIRKVVCLGRNVGKVFGFADTNPFLSIRRSGDRTYLLLPHPSGRNRWWNAPENVRLASRQLRHFLYG